MKIIKFKVSGQEQIRLTHESIVAGSQNYLACAFSFEDPDYEGKTKIANFVYGDLVFSQLIKDGTCEVPPEVIKPPYFTMSLTIGNLITIKPVTVTVDANGLPDGVYPVSVTLCLYEQMIAEFTQHSESAKASADRAESQAETASLQAKQAAQSAEQAAQSADQANTIKTDCDTILQSVGELKAQVDADAMKSAANAAQAAESKAECEEIQQNIQNIKAVMDTQAETVSNAAASAVQARDDAQTALSEVLSAKEDMVDIADTKVDKMDGKGLSQNDYTDADKALVSGMPDALLLKIDKPNGRVYIGDIVLKKWKQSNGNDYSNNETAFCLTANVEPNSTYYASGMVINEYFPLIVMFDSNNKVIAIKEAEGSYVKKNDIEFVTPSNCASVAINGRQMTNNTGPAYPSLYYIGNTDIDSNTLVGSINDKQSKVIEWKQANYQYELNKYISITNKKAVAVENSSSNGYVYAKLKYDKDKKYRFFGQCRTSTIPILICCDENDEIIKYYGASIGYAKAKEYEIPGNVSYIYVNGYSPEMSARIEVMEERNITSFESNKIGVFFGDSITQGNNVLIGSSVTPFNDYPSVVGRLLNCTVYNGGLGGSTFSSGRSIDFTNVVDCVVSGDFSTVIDGITQYGLNQSAIIQYEAISQLDFNNVDFVSIALGTNDWNFGSTVNNVKTSMSYCLDKLLTAYPHLKIYVFTPIYRFNLGDNSEDSNIHINSSSGLKLYQICEAIIEEAKAFNIPCKDMYHESNINSYTITTYFKGTDGTHPNAKGYALMGEKIAKFINAN